MRLRQIILGLFLSLSAMSIAKAEVVITFGGDLNLTQSRAAALKQQTSKNGSTFDWEQLYSGLRPLLIGELNFANIETVVSDQSSLSEASSPSGNKRKFVFRMHPDGLAYGMGLGLNLFSMANNHTADYGRNGMLETMLHMYSLSNQFQFWESGLGSTKDQAAQPALVKLDTDRGPVTIAFLAMTAVHGEKERAEAGDNIGILSFYNEGDFKAAMRGLRQAKADYRILSVHWGKEGSLEVQPRQREWGHRALREGEVDLILGHHPHRVQPAERVGDKLIFYSLGNYLMVGAANLNQSGPGHDYGLMGRLYLETDSKTGRLKPEALEAVPLTNLHEVSRAMKREAAAKRIEIFNTLGSQQFGKTALKLVPAKLGGKLCFDAVSGARASALCRYKD